MFLMDYNDHEFDLNESDISSIAIIMADTVRSPRVIEREMIPSRILVHGRNAHLEEIAMGVQHLLPEYVVESRSDYPHAQDGVFSLHADYFVSRYFSRGATQEFLERYD